ncbi:LysR family transcriptional regulator [Ruminococcus sp.]|uniref:LysR family transcriptional regulator n=1 Tax=Ruminococcus sp. TaxID=41978 RepID=UPI0025DC34C6|nr:LysR family transcriptional regulator [Ruminococcus sp.]MBQ8966565.1 LysR family transcriptional regulator [Ruminococcus sp.]
MNLTHLRYVVEVERLGSITKAASALYMGQPNLSKAIKEMEHEVGIPIFKRSAKGVVPTEKGKEFLQYAKAILVQLDKMEALYKDDPEDSVSFSLLLPRASYITHAFTCFLNKLSGRQDMDVKIKETNSMDTINAVVECEYDMGIIRYPIAYESFFLPLLEEKNLSVHSSWQYDYVLIMSADSPLAQEEEITEEVLEKYIEVLHGDNTVPNISAVYQKKNAALNRRRRHIYVYERGSQFDILSACPEAYMWVSPMPREILDRCRLVQRSVPNISKTNKDVLIYQSSYRLSATDRMFIEEMDKVRQEIMQDL